MVMWYGPNDRNFPGLDRKNPEGKIRRIRGKNPVRPRDSTGFSPRIRRIFPSGNIRSNPGKFRLFGPYDITIGALHMVMDVSVTEANLNNASFHWGCNLATHCSVFVQLCLRKAHLFSGVEGRIQSVTKAKGEGLGAGPRRAPTILNWRRMMARQSFVLPANSVLLQVLKMI